MAGVLDRIETRAAAVITKERLAISCIELQDSEWTEVERLFFQFLNEVEVAGP
jgi:hypothetical protein